MNEIIEVLKSCILFKDMTGKDISDILNKIKYSTPCFSKEQTIAIEDDECSNIGIVVKGSVEIQKIYESGKKITIERLKPGEIFGEVIIFSSAKKYPSTVVSIEESKVMFIHRDEILKISGTNTMLLNRFMELLSNKIIMLNKKLKSLSYHTLRQKIANYILEEHKKQKNLKIILPYKRCEMAEQLGVTRPSLSREFVNMRNNGLFDFSCRTVMIKDLNGLENALSD